MRFLLVAARELRSAAHQKTTYRVRWITAAIFFGLLVWLLWACGGFTNHWAVPRIFRTYSVLTLLYCLFISAARTADSISAERREGTLGLLFLTNLNSAEIMVGKLCSHALASVYGLLAIFPMLALPLLMGGVSMGNFGRTLLALLNGILFALAAGFLASVLCRRQFTAIAFALGSIVCIGGGLLLAGAAANSYAPTRPLANWLSAFSPIYPLMIADGTGAGLSRFWHSAGAISGASLAGLGLTTLLLARSWRDRPKREGGWFRRGLGRWSRQTNSPRRAALRRRLLAVNPVFWLAAPKPVNAPVLMFLAVALTLLAVYVAAPYFGRVLPAGTAKPVLGHLVAWLCTGLLIHALVLYYAATSAAQRLAEDKQAGALELILSTPTTERTITRGLWLAYARKMLFPALLAMLVHFYFIWQFLVMASLEPPGRIPPGTPPAQLFWSALMDEPIDGQLLQWEFGFMLHIALLILLLVFVCWPTLGWVGRWLGLRMKHPGFAPMASLALLFVPPILLFSFACYAADKLNLNRLPNRHFFPMMMWLAFAIGAGHCLGLSFWAATRLRHNLRSIAMSRYQPLPAWRWRLPGRRALRRCTTFSVGFVVITAAVILSYYGYQNWRGRRAWRTFQAALKQSGEPLEVSQLLAQPAPPGVNLARSAAFLVFLNKTNRESTDLFTRLRAFDLPASGGGGTPFLVDWSRQSNSALYLFINWTGQQPRAPSATNRLGDAANVLKGMEPFRGELDDLAAAARRLAVFQPATNRGASVVLHPALEPALLLERLHLLFQVRTCALLAVGRSQEATEDLAAGLHLVRLARQLPGARSTMRVQYLLARSLQPLWEGLGQRAWTEPELAAFQHELAGFNLLADYTDAVRLIVQAHIEVWREIPNGAGAESALTEVEGGYARGPAWQLEPRAWWYERCLQLHNAGRNAIEQVNLATGRIQSAYDWFDLNGLPLDSQTTELLQQSLWWGANPGNLAFVQTSVNQAIIACALERFRLANQRYPETLDELMPAFLDHIPHDAVSGRPIIYQPGDNGSFILRGVGPNGIDDRKNSGSDDWLWTYPVGKP